MPRRPGKDIYRVTVRGAGPVAANFTRRQRALQDVFIAEMRQLGTEATEVLRGFTPQDTGDLEQAVGAVPFFGVASSIRISIRVAPLLGHRGDERDNFDYLTVTRRGHRVSVITPVTARALKVHYAGHRNPAVFVYRGAQPATRSGSIRGGLKGDWVEAAGPDLARLNDQAAERLGRQIRARVL